MADGESSGASLGKVFRSRDGCHWYDTARNGLYRVDPVLADVLEIFDGDNDGEVAARLGGLHAPAELTRALDEIRRARRDEGLFAPNGPPAVPPRDEVGSRGPATGFAHLTLGLTDHCNLGCRYCPQAVQPDAARRTMREETARRAVAWFAEHHHDAATAHVSFYGGEPLLRLDLIESVVAAARRRSRGPAIDFTIDTNATLIDDRAALFLAREGIGLQVSLDGPPRIHDRHRRGRNGGRTHARVLAGLRKVLAVDPSMAERIRFVATLTPPYEIQEVCDYFARFPLYRELGLDCEPAVRVNFANLDGSDLAARMDGAAAGRQWAAAMDGVRERYQAGLLAGRRATLPRGLAGLFDDPLVRWHHRRRTGFGATSFPAGACHPGRRRLYVGPDGRFLPCERAGAERVIGDLDRGLDPEAIEALHRELLEVVDHRCPTCWAQRLCGICFTSLRPGLPREEARARAARDCASASRRAEAAIRLYLDIHQHDEGALTFLAETTML